MKKIQKSWHWFEISLIFLSILLHLYVVLSPASSLANWYTSDDGYYYFKVAVNVTSGHGVTFDGFNQTNGFQPLWMLICIPVFMLARFNLVLPLRVLVLVSALISAGTGIILFRLLKKFIFIETAMAMAIFWVFLPSIHEIVVQNGMESGISAFFLALLLYLVFQWREEHIESWKVPVLGAIAGLTILARLDNIFIVMLLGIWFVFGYVGAYLRTVVIGDLALIFIVGLLSYYFRLNSGPVYVTMSASLPWLVGLGFILKPAFLFLFGLYDPASERFSWKFLGRSALAVLLVSGIIGICLLVFQKIGLYPTLPRSVILIDCAGTLLSVVGLRLLSGFFFCEKAAPDKTSFRSLVFWKKILPRLFGYFGPLVLLMAIYMMWSYLYVGIPMPVSGQIKYWWGSIYTVYGSGVNSIPELFSLQKGGGPWQLIFSIIDSAENPIGMFLKPEYLLIISWVLGLFILALVAFLVFSQRRWLSGLLDRMGLFALFLGIYSHNFSYKSTSYIHVRSWYWVGGMFFTVLCLGILMECTRRILNRWRGKLWVWRSAMLMLSLAVLALFCNMLLQRFPYLITQKIQENYQANIRALEDSTEPGALIGMTGGGEIGYFIHDRTIVNLDGLINSPEYFRMLRAGRGAVFLDWMGLDYVYGNGYMLTESDPYRQLLDGHLGKLAWVGDVILYRYVPSP